MSRMLLHIQEMYQEYRLEDQAIKDIRRVKIIDKIMGGEYNSVNDVARGVGFKFNYAMNILKELCEDLRIPPEEGRIRRNHVGRIRDHYRSSEGYNR